MGILEQMRLTRRHPFAALLGAALGGFVPIAAYTIVHHELRIGGRLELMQPIALVLLACLAFSVRTVWQWGVQSFGERTKAACLVVAVEGVMVFSDTPALAVIALSYLVAINAIATACTLIAEDTHQPQQTAPAVEPAPAPELPRGKAVGRIAARVRPA